MATGRPLKYKTPAELQKAVDEYFKKSKDDKTPTTITGLAYELGFESRQSIYDYEKSGKFSYTIKRARLRVEMGYEINLHSTAAAGSIFALKNFSWRDKFDDEAPEDFDPSDEFL